jgi:simple sugar transport system permease protein
MSRKILDTFIPVLSVLSALLLSSVIIYAAGQNPVMVYQKMIRSTFGSDYGLGQVIFRSTTLILTGLAVALPFKVRLFNIGGEGQLLMGAFAAALAGITLPSWLPPSAGMTACLLASMAAGASWAICAGWLKIRFGVNEVISTIMLNFIAQAVTGYLLTYHFAVPSTVHTPPVAASAELPKFGDITGMLGRSPANVTSLAALTVCAGSFFMLYHSRFGYEMRAVGLKPEAAEYAGIRSNLHILAAMGMAGAVAGLGAGNLVLGYKHYYEAGLTAGAGFMGIAVALLANAHPIWIVFSALLFGWLDYGGLTVNTYVPKDIFMMVQGLTILCILSFTALFRRFQDR